MVNGPSTFDNLVTGEAGDSRRGTAAHTPIGWFPLQWAR
jgi:hypothetical protein